MADKRKKKRSRNISMESFVSFIKKSLIFHAKRIVLRLSSRFRGRRISGGKMKGLVKLYKDIEDSSYTDIQVMWKMVRSCPPERKPETVKASNLSNKQA